MKGQTLGETESVYGLRWFGDIPATRHLAPIMTCVSSSNQGIIWSRNAVGRIVTVKMVRPRELRSNLFHSRDFEANFLGKKVFLHQFCKAHITLEDIMARTRGKNSQIVFSSSWENWCILTWMGKREKRKIRKERGRPRLRETDRLRLREERLWKREIDKG